MKNKVKYQFNEIISQEVTAISIYSTKGSLICAFSYENRRQNLLTENSEAMICLGEDLKTPLIEVFENHSFKMRFLRKIKIEQRILFYCIYF